MIQIKTNAQIKRHNVKAFQKEMNQYLLTSRFTNATFQENKQYRLKNNVPCIYCSPDPITKKIPSDAIVFVLEMNNEQNRIEGIGMIRNHPIVNKYNVYQEGNYNRYVFKGKYYINRLEMVDKEEDLMQAFDILCFKGNKHMKRGQGLKSFPIEMLYNCRNTLNIVKFICNMFKTRMENKSNTIKT